MPSADDELILDYLAESQEHLANIEADLLTVEQGAAHADEEVVNRVFRAAHSIKGGAGFFDLTKIRELAHKTENVLDMIRSRKMIPTPEVISTLLLAFDKLREMILDHKSSQEADISDFVGALMRLVSENLPPAEQYTTTAAVELTMPVTGHVIQVSALDLKQMREAGQHLYWIEVDLIHDVQRREKTPYSVISDLNEAGTIIESVFDLDSAGLLEDEPANRLLLRILHATKVAAGPLAIFLEIPFAQVQPLDTGITEPAAVAGQPPTPVAEAIPQPGEPKAAEPAPAPAAQAASPQAAPAETIRLNVGLLDSLMTLAGELVLSRNQLTESLAKKDQRGIRASAQRVNLVTSELQEVVSLTRMQPVGSVLSKFPRLVRDLARELGKSVQIRLEGVDVELDKTILEGLADPLTHMVRNAVDHGIESAEMRAAQGKRPTGTIVMKAAHQAGQVVIEVSDDGKGLDPAKIAAASLAKGRISAEQLSGMSDREKLSLILLPGVSTADKVSDVSGRGVGMDVVKTNLDRLGGKIEIESTVGRGSSFRIKLPLTLAIIPSLLVSDHGARYAVPQMNVAELIRIPKGQVTKRIRRVGDGEVLLLRDRLVPLLHLAEAQGFERNPANGAWNVVLVNTGVFEYGLVVDELHDTAEIVVKPLGRHLKGLHDYAGATILGDGRVALILDVAGVAARASLSPSATKAAPPAGSEAAPAGEAYSLLTFHNSPAEVCAVPIYLVTRIERIRHSQIEYLGGRRVLQYRSASLPVIALSDVAAVGSVDESQLLVVIVFEHGGRNLGLLAAEPLDMLETNIALDRRTLRQTGISGSAFLKGRTTLVLDLHEIAESTHPMDTPSAEPVAAGEAATEAPTVILAEDSDLFRTQLRRLIEGVGCTVLTAPDGEAAWELLESNAGKVALVAADIDMPRMDGLTLTRRIRADERFASLPVIAVSALADDAEIAAGLAAGVTEYQIKLNKEELANSVRRIVGACVPAGVETRD